jgi:hypothetical protein
MRRLLCCAASLLIGTGAVRAQTPVIPPLDKSALDISYYPVNHPILKIQDKATEPLMARVIYSRPVKAGRRIAGNLFEYGSVWRLGANEATEIEFFRDARIADKTVKKGRYTLYAIPNPDRWTLIINRETDTWGAFRYDPSKDVGRFTAKPEKNPDPVEAFTVCFDGNGKLANLHILWDDFHLTLPIRFL